MDLTTVRQWEINSDSRVGLSYTVTRHPAEHAGDQVWDCTCPSFAYAQTVNPRCKHIDKVRTFFTSYFAAVLDGTVLPTHLRSSRGRA